MKLLLCTYCGDVRKLRSAEAVECQCGRSKGRYLSDGLHSIVSGETARVVGLDNHTLTTAVRTDRKTNEPGIDVISFLFPIGHKRAETVSADDRRLQ